MSVIAIFQQLSGGRGLRNVDDTRQLNCREQAFGKARDVWLTELSDPKSVAAKLNERFEKCTTSDSRHSYDTY